MADGDLDDLYNREENIWADRIVSLVISKPDEIGTCTSKNPGTLTSTCSHVVKLLYFIIVTLRYVIICIQIEF